jgi:putative transposase
MPRTARVSVGDTAYHVINRSNGRVTIFDNEKDFNHFESLILEAKELTNMRILAYCIMPNHFHLVLYPRNDGNMGEFMRWLTTTHVRQRRTMEGSIGSGHLYQGTYKSFPVERDKYLVDLIRYVEQNPLRAKLVKKAENWRWSSLYGRLHGSIMQKKILDKLITELPENYLKSVNEMYNGEKLAEFRRSLNKCTPFGSEKWVSNMVEKFNQISTTRNPGRPKRL